MYMQQTSKQLNSECDRETQPTATAASRASQHRIESSANSGSNIHNVIVLLFIMIILFIIY